MIGNRIRALLAQQERTVQELALHCGVSAQSVYNWLEDVVQPRDARKKAIALFFGTTPKDLEYGPVLSLVDLPPRVRKGHAKLDLPVAEHTADLIMSAELNNHPPKSFEYMEGMRAAILQLLSGQKHKPAYQIGSCQLDAFEAGFVHGQKLISKD